MLTRRSFRNDHDPGVECIAFMRYISKEAKKHGRCSQAFTSRFLGSNTAEPSVLYVLGCNSLKRTLSSMVSVNCS